MRDELEAAFIAIFGPVPPSEYDGRAWTRNEPDFSPAWTAYIARQVHFRRFLDAEAYLDAAMILVPEGASWSLFDVIGKPESVRMYGDGFDVLASADNPAMALAKASLKARGMEA